MNFWTVICRAVGIVPVPPPPLKVTVTVIILVDWYEDLLHKKSRFRSATKRFNALKFGEQCFHFKEYLRSPDTFRTYPYFIIHKWDKQNFRKKVEHFTWNEHRQKLFHDYNDQFIGGKYIFPCFLIL